MEKRRRLKEKLQKNEIKKEQREVEMAIDLEVTVKRNEALEEVQNEHDRKLKLLVETVKDDEYHIKELQKETD